MHAKEPIVYPSFKAHKHFVRIEVNKRDEGHMGSAGNLPFADYFCCNSSFLTEGMRLLPNTSLSIMHASA